MTKTQINTLIKNMHQAGILTKKLEWQKEGFGEKIVDVRHIGIKPFDELLEIFSPEDHLLIKFLFTKKQSIAELYIANVIPFFKIIQVPLDHVQKWEHLLGPIKNRLKKDKQLLLSHQETADNLYQKILPILKKKK